MRKLSDKEIIERYGYYYDYLKKMGEFGVGGKSTIKKLDLPRGIVQQAYKEMNEEGNSFMGNIIEYLQWISGNFIVWMFRRTGFDYGTSAQLRKERKAFTILLYTFFSDFVNLYNLYKKNREYIINILDDIDSNLVVEFEEEINKLGKKVKVIGKLRKEKYVLKIDLPKKHK